MVDSKQNKKKIISLEERENNKIKEKFKIMLMSKKKKRMTTDKFSKTLIYYMTCISKKLNSQKFNIYKILIIIFNETLKNK